MLISKTLPPVFEKLIAPLQLLFSQCKKLRNCPALEDTQWALAGLRRILSQEPSGRGFLQQLHDLGSMVIGRSNFFKTLKSERRLGFVEELNDLLSDHMKEVEVDPLSEYGSLNSYDIYAGDGHYRAAATHDPRIDGKKYAVGHFYTLDLRTHALTHLDSSLIEEGRKKEHDMHLLKRLSEEQLRQGAPEGRKVLYVWDRAGIDFLQWYEWKRDSDIYFLSREKENMKPEVIGELKWDKEDPINSGVIADELISTSKGVSLRRVRYRCPRSGEVYHFITNVLDLAPGLIAHLYKMRWDIEKVFDELKTKLTEKKAWASGQTARNMQAMFTCLMHNLMVLLENNLEKSEGITDEQENQRREKRLCSASEQAAQRDQLLPQPQQVIQRATQRGQKFIRWLRNHQWQSTSWPDALNSLRYAYGMKLLC